MRVFIEQSDNGIAKREIERLVAGEKIKKEIRQELAYKDMHRSIDNLWSILLTTGYLTQKGRQEGNEFSLAIPNVEIRNIFTSHIMEFFKERVKEDVHTLNQFCDALERGDAKEVEKCFTGKLANEVINGKWGVGEDRKKRLTEAGYDYDTVQAKVNEKMGVNNSSSEITYTVKKGGFSWK